MTSNATIYKAALQVTDMDRNYYQDHALTIARHPSETDERMMVRVMAFARHAGEALEFARGSVGAQHDAPHEPDLWQKDLTGDIELWIEVGQPEEKAVRQACGRAKQVVIYTYSGHKADKWWEQSRAGLEKTRNLTIINLPPETTQALALLAQRDMQLYCTVQDGQLSMNNGEKTVEVAMTTLKTPQEHVR